MPYLTPAAKLDIEITVELDRLANYIASKNEGEFEGIINYINYYIAKKRFGKGAGYRRYKYMNAWVGAMYCCVQEVQRRIIAEYEDEAIQKNGDV